MDEPQDGHPQASAGRWFLRGMARVASVPAFILMASFVGFAGLARAADVGLVQSVLMVAVVWALPSMVVMVGAIKAGTSLAATFLAVSLSAVRLMPMVVAILPILKSDRTSRPMLYLLSHFVAVTAWLFGMTELPGLPRPARVPYFAGFAMTLVGCCMVVTGLAYVAAGALPAVLGAGLTLLTPLYFTVSLWRAARLRVDRLALVVGIAVAPLFHRLHPEFELVWTGLVGGTIAYLIGRALDRRAARPEETA